VRYSCTDKAFMLEFTQTPQDAGETLLYIHKPFAQIECDGTWDVARQYENGARLLRLRTEPDTHRVTVHFE
jgi:hypothetical protein